MKKAEIINIFKYLISNYTDFERKMANKENADNQLELWYDTFKNYDKIILENAVAMHINTSKFAPTIADINENIYKLINDEKPAIDVWNEAYECICNGNYNAEEYFKNASEIVKRFFGSPRQIRELAMTDIDTINTIVKGQFLKQYEILKTRQKQDNVISSETKKIINELSKKLNLGG